MFLCEHWAMKPCCAQRFIKETIADMKARDPMASGLADRDFVFETSELYEALQLKHTVPEIQQMVDALLPLLDEGQGCRCGVHDIQECGQDFVAIIDMMFVRPVEQ